MTSRCPAWTRAILLLSALATLGACGDVTGPVAPPRPPVVVAPPATADIDTNAARIAWAFVERNSTPATGLANAIGPFRFVTAWDIASVVGATWSARAVGVIGDSLYAARMQTILATLSTMPLYQGVAFNRLYDSRTGAMVDDDRLPSATGTGWSAWDTGRLLTWLRIVAVNDPRFTAAATAVARRIDMSRLVRDGTLYGHDVSASGAPIDYAETGLGYEQYAATGFALWGTQAAASLDASAHAAPVSVEGVTVYTDARGDARITSEPYLMMGLETGFRSDASRQQAVALLAAQEARYTRTGVLTMVSEDALPDPPYYFYYYSVLHGDHTFAVEGPDDGTFTDAPRWVSTKAAFGWNALFPSSYTGRAMDLVGRAAIGGEGWGAGVYESTGLPTGEPSINTAALVLESLAYQSRRGPLLAQ